MNFRSAREAFSSLLSLAISVFEARHAHKVPFHEQESARKRYCTGFLDGYAEAMQQMMPDLDTQVEVEKAKQLGNQARAEIRDI